MTQLQDSQNQREIESLQEELKHFREEKEKVRMLLGQIGGANENKRDKVLNFAFISLLAGLLLHDIIAHFWPGVGLFDFRISLELGVLMVSLKIIWMMHRQAKVEHFQFWILNSIEFRLTEMSKRIKEIQQQVNDSPPPAKKAKDIE